MKYICIVVLVMAIVALSVQSSVASGSKTSREQSENVSKSLKIKNFQTKEVLIPKVKSFAIPGISVSAYTASVRECGKDDGITASGIKVHDGVVACNFLPFGALVKIPGMFGNKVFVVRDRMARDNFNNIDIYVDDVDVAWEIGRSDQTIVVIN